MYTLVLCVPACVDIMRACTIPAALMVSHTHGKNHWKQILDERTGRCTEACARDAGEAELREVNRVAFRVSGAKANGPRFHVMFHSLQ